MKRLILLRHAKSDWSDDDLNDHERPLNARGRDAAARIGRYMREHDLKPDLVVCSTARRTVETLARVLAESGHAPEVVYDRRIYLAMPDLMLKVAEEKAGDAATVMIVGHNPGTEALACALAARGDRETIAKLHAKYPTGAISVFECDGGGWDSIGGGATLSRYAMPRELPSSA